MRLLFYISLLLYTAILSAMFTEIDYDFWARLIVGKTFFQTGSVMNYDFLSYTPTHRWIDHEWGSSVVFYFIQEHFSDFGLFILKTALTFLTYFILIQTLNLRRKYTKGEVKFDIFNILFFIFTIQAAAEFIFSTIRCQIFTFFFFALWLYILEKARLEKHYGLLWILPVSMIIWTNLHGGSFIGLVLISLYIIGEFLNKKEFLPFLYAAVASFCACAISPYGIEYVKFLLMATTMKRSNITEWQGLFNKIHTLNFFKFKFYATVICTIISIFIVRKFRQIKACSIVEKIKKFYDNTDKTKALILIATLLLSIKSIRFIPFFTFCTIAFLYDDIYRILSKKLPDNINKLKEILLYILILISFITLVLFKPVLYTVSENAYPVREIDFIKVNEIKGNLMVNFHFGSYAAYKLYPNNHIFMDGRYEEVYDDELLSAMKKIHLGDRWTENLAKYHTDMIIAEKRYIFYQALDKSPDWVLVTQSKNYGLFLRKEKALKEKYYLPLYKKHYFDKTKWETDIDWLK